MLSRHDHPDRHWTQLNTVWFSQAMEPNRREATEAITFTAVKTKTGEAIKVTAGDMVFTVPRIAFDSDSHHDVTVADGKLRLYGVGVGRSAGTDRRKYKRNQSRLVFALRRRPRCPGQPGRR